MIKKCMIILFASMVISQFVCGQIGDTAFTGYLPDAAEERWPIDTQKNALNKAKHLSAFHGKGIFKTGASIREGVEYFKGYLWGMGPQNGDGYALQRVLVHSDFRYGKFFRLFTEFQSSLIFGRNGGPRPVQDLNELSIHQLFGELSVSTSVNSRLKVRLGKQHLNYGQGTLLDLRDANVRRPFVGGKLLWETGKTRVDVFAMKAIATHKGIFDDATDDGQKIGGLWITRMLPESALAKIDVYYLVIGRDHSSYNQGNGKELRHTLGSGFSLNKNNWFSFSEMDFQWGKFNGGNILAWKLASSVGYRFKWHSLMPAFSIQGAISSGDSDTADHKLQTFNPIYPKAIFYGFIDNAGSSNLIVIHPKVELRISGRMTMAVGYYTFWRQRSADGIYAVNGSFLLPASRAGKHVGNMGDLYAQFHAGKHCVLHLVSAYYRRGTYLKAHPMTKSDILYFALKVTINI